MFQESSAPAIFPETEEPMLAGRSRSRSPHRQSLTPHFVGDVVAQRKTVTCQSTQTLGDACDAMMKEGRTSAVILDEEGLVKGVLTENDILTAFMDGRGVGLSISSWLDSRYARLPESILPSMTLKHDQPLIEAARIMMKEAEKDSGHACHHVLVSKPGCKLYLLSALDIAMALIGDPGDMDEADTAHTKVSTVMKRRDHMASCKLSDKLSEACEIMLQEKQNMVLVMDADAHPGSQICGVITPADAMRTFSESVSSEDVTVGSWLSAQPEERCIPEFKTLSDAATKMSESGTHHLIVLSKQANEVAGVISALDIARALGHHSDWLL